MFLQKNHAIDPFFTMISMWEDQARQIIFQLFLFHFPKPKPGFQKSKNCSGPFFCPSGTKRLREFRDKNLPLSENIKPSQHCLRQQPITNLQFPTTPRFLWSLSPSVNKIKLARRLIPPLPDPNSVCPPPSPQHSTKVNFHTAAPGTTLLQASSATVKFTFLRSFVVETVQSF